MTSDEGPDEMSHDAREYASTTQCVSLQGCIFEIFIVKVVVQSFRIRKYAHNLFYHFSKWHLMKTLMKCRIMRENTRVQHAFHCRDVL